MAHTLEQFARHCHDLLKAQPGPAGRQQVAELLKEVLVDQKFVEANLGPNIGEREVVYEDPELGFCIVAHNYQGAKSSTPHDHAHSWAIYGQARGETEMRDYALIEAAAGDKPGKVRQTKTYTLTPGVAHVYNEGDLHAPERMTSTSLIRIEGTNMSKVKRAAYEVV
jgi:predicted metal-dependent enzyme (double-stranded beta helix superfamily)